MRNKKEYISPAVKVVSVEMTQLLAESGSDDNIGGNQGENAKGYRGFWDNAWSDETEEEKPMFQQPKSLWD